MKNTFTVILKLNQTETSTIHSIIFGVTSIVPNMDGILIQTENGRHEQIMYYDFKCIEVDEELLFRENPYSFKIRYDENAMIERLLKYPDNNIRYIDGRYKPCSNDEYAHGGDKYHYVQ